MGEESFFPIVPTAVTAVAGLLIAGIVVMAVFDRISRGLGAALGGVVFGVAQTYLLWHLDVFELGLGLFLGVLTGIAVGVLLKLFLRKVEA